MISFNLSPVDFALQTNRGQHITRVTANRRLLPQLSLYIMSIAGSFRLAQLAVQVASRLPEDCLVFTTLAQEL